MIWILVLFSLLACDVVLHLTYAWFILRIFESKPPFVVPTIHPDPNAETVSCETVDGLTLRGSIHRHVGGDTKGIILFCPELDGSHWSASVYARGLLDAGFDVVSFDFRNQGESDYQPGYVPLHWATTFEVEDVRAALRFIQARKDLRDLPLGIMGVSRGSTAALIAAAETEHVKAVCCEGAYSTDSLTLHFIFRWATMYAPKYLLRILPVWHVYLTSVLVRLTSQFLRKRPYVVLEKWLPKLKERSVLLVAGERDNYVHPDIGRGLLKRIDSDSVQFWLVPRARHNCARHVAPAEYDRRLQDFFSRTLTVGT